MKLDFTSRSRRPLCLLDIDGVIALLGPGNGEPTFEAVIAGYPVTIAVAARQRLSRLASVFHMVWASAWMQDAAEALGPLLHLPDDLPFLRFDPEADRDAPTYKLPVVKCFIRDRPAAWVDDELGEDVIAWADQRDQPTFAHSARSSHRSHGRAGRGAAELRGSAQSEAVCRRAMTREPGNSDPSQAARHLRQVPPVCLGGGRECVSVQRSR